jgi:uncharacterized membrane protein
LHTRHRDERRRRRMLEVTGRRLRNPLLNSIVERNIATLHELRAELEASKAFKDRVADWITAWSGSMPFIVLHVVWFAAWIAVNCHLTPLRHFDPFPFPLLTMIVSLEAIFLSTFVLVSQNRQAEVDSERNELDLQIDLLAEYELTRVLTLVDAIADHLGIEVAKDPELDELKRDVVPEAVVKELQQRKAEEKQGNGAAKSSAATKPAGPEPQPAG